MSSAVSEVLQRFDELENARSTNLGKVDPPLIVDMILRQKKQKDPLYTLEVFIKPKQNTEEIKNRIINETGMVPAFYDAGTHIVSCSILECFRYYRCHCLSRISSCFWAHEG